MLFFDNSACVNCERVVGFSEIERAVVGVDGDPNGNQPLIDASGRQLWRCANWRDFGVCNRLVSADVSDGNTLCLACGLNRTVPDQSVEGNDERWAKLEAAKRRMLYDLELIGWPMDVPDPDQGSAPPLVFKFMADAMPEDGHWVPMADGEPVYTGHADGVITVNLKEADDLERERMRLNLGEPQRSLIGHFRHEVGHYFWDRFFKHNDAARRRCVAVFGDHEDPSYSDAMERHYKEGAPDDWRERYVSAYATMHPWEDWAESWSLYLEAYGTMDTLSARNMATWPEDAAGSGFGDLLTRYLKQAVALNELARNRGMTLMHPEAVSTPVLEKLRFMNEVVQGSRRAGQPS